MSSRSWPLFVAPLLLAACGSQGEPLGTAAQAGKVCGAAMPPEGIDVSHYDGQIDWATVAQGRAFAFLKATEGDAFVDPTFATNWDGVQKNGLVGGAYHFFHADIDPMVQAQHFLQTIGTVSGHPLAVLDLETDNGQPGSVVAANAATWMAAVQAATGKPPILYVSPSFFDGTLGSPAGFDKDLLWVANWQVMCPNVPGTWATWVFWQYDSMGTVAGIPGANNVDLNRFNGTLAELKALEGGGSSTTGTGGNGAGGNGAGGNNAGGSGPSGGTGAGGHGATTTTSGAGGAQSATTTTTGTGAPAGSSGSSGTGGSGSTSGAASPGQKSGCAVAPGGQGGAAGAWLAALGLLLGARRRRRI